jgi:hypothetical protein
MVGFKFFLSDYSHYPCRSIRQAGEHQSFSLLRERNLQNSHFFFVYLRNSKSEKFKITYLLLQIVLSLHVRKFSLAVASDSPTPVTDLRIDNIC